MKILYLECNMGAAGDMLMAALWELAEDVQRQAFVEQMNRLGLPEVTLRPVGAAKCGICGTHMQVTVAGQEEQSVDVHPQEQMQDMHSHAHTHDDTGMQDMHHHEHTHDADMQHMHHHEHEHTHDDASMQDMHSHAHTHDADMQHSHSHAHTSYAHIRELVNALSLPEKVKQDVINVYGLLAEAEGRAHGKTVEEIHFHEVGNMDAVCDIVGVCLLMEMLSPDRVIASPVHVGSGQVRCAHGILPVPTPATAYLLKDVPVYGGNIPGELCTPTGAALLKYFADEFAQMPILRIKSIGYGMGSKDFAQANCVRAIWGESDASLQQIVELCCNLDDMTPEALGFAQEILMEQGALDVYTTAVGMKKCRPGILLTCMCREQDRERMLALLFRHTTTLGVREKICNRYTLERREKTVQTACGEVRIKEAFGYGTSRCKPEYEDMARIAREQGISLREAQEEIS